ncbi:M48 family metallopeptidase [Nocardiopsis sp. YSL2]|uniref:M48 family metallopeptidase n=1 Tax=Nocardiopsis sp. YSL2 TaxID=2939492 RepID=UPI0026F4734B|nr:SprT family zinc-dependent metalloprotease [Nocardiopsis sp. YSL2]
MNPATTDPDSGPLSDGDRLVTDSRDLRVSVNPRRTRFALTVETDASVTLHVPEGRSEAEAREFVQAHRSWVDAKIALRERTRALNPAKRLVEGEIFRYLGRTYRLAVDPGLSADTPVRLVAGRLVMGEDLLENTSRGKAALVDWYCRVGRGWALGRLQPWAARMAVAEPDLAVRDLGGRWGTYRPDSKGRGTGRMSLGWPLFQLPMPLADYVIAHELAHVRVPGHGADFWRLLGRALPEWKERRAELDELGRRLWMGRIGS